QVPPFCAHWVVGGAGGGGDASGAPPSPLPGGVPELAASLTWPRYSVDEHPPAERMPRNRTEAPKPRISMLPCFRPGPGGSRNRPRQSLGNQSTDALRERPVRVTGKHCSSLSYRFVAPAERDERLDLEHIRLDTKHAVRRTQSITFERRERAG